MAVPQVRFQTRAPDPPSVRRDCRPQCSYESETLAPVSDTETWLSPSSPPSVLPSVVQKPYVELRISSPEPLD